MSPFVSPLSAIAWAHNPTVVDALAVYLSGKAYEGSVYIVAFAVVHWCLMPKLTPVAMFWVL